MFSDSPNSYWSQFNFSPTPVKSRRENGYMVTRYIAEFWCFASSLVIMLVGISHGCISLTVAGTVSCISHAIPFSFLLTLDKLAMLGVFIEFSKYYERLIEQPWLLGLVPVIAAINWTDMYAARYHGLTIFHVFWHLSAAGIAHLFLSNVN